MKPPDWYAEEQSRRSIDEVRRLWLRGQRRPVLLAVSVCVILAAYTYKKARPPIEKHTARAAFVVREFTGKRGTTARERPPTALMMQEHLGKVLYNRTTLLAIMKETRPFGRLPELDPDKAVKKFKETSGFFLKENGFADEGESGPRSAKLVLKFTHRDAVLASVVVEAMARSVHEIETRSREQFYEAAASLARARLEEEHERLRTLESQLTALRHRDKNANRGALLDQKLGARVTTLQKVQSLLKVLGSDQKVTTEAEGWAMLDRLKRTKTRSVDELLIRGEESNEAVIALRVQIEAAKYRVGEVARSMQQVMLSRAEDRRSGIQFDLVDSSTISLVPRIGPLGVLWRSILAFLVLVPLCAITIGAFDAKVYTTEDLERLGVKILGAIPAFPGDGVASLRERMKSAAGSQPSPLT